jgi:hypothetical protein
MEGLNGDKAVYEPRLRKRPLDKSAVMEHICGGVLANVDVLLQFRGQVVL